MLGIFIGYIIYTFVCIQICYTLEFVTNNAPRVNQFTDQLPYNNITLPQIAFGFFYGDP
jgi:hypothetical protein